MKNQRLIDGRARSTKLVALSSGVLLAATLVAAPAQAVSPIFGGYIEPVPATPDDVIVYYTWWNGCGTLRAPTITQHGQAIAVEQPIEEFCGIPIGGLIHYELGRFPAGTYVVRLASCSYWLPHVCFGNDSPPDVMFSVAGEPTQTFAQPTPASGPVALVTLALALALAVMSARARLQRTGRPD